MANTNTVTDAILTQGLLPLFFYADADVSLEVLRTLYNAGVRVIEYTNRGKEALANFKVLSDAAKAEMPGLYLGIGTIKTGPEAEVFIAAGADFIVSPILNKEVGTVADHHGLLWIPGCMTPTEIHTAQQYKAQIIKLFPANSLGPAFVSAIRDLFPGQLFIPTGGVEIESGNISAWFRSGVCAVGLGSKLISAEVLDERLYEQLYADTIKALELVQLSK